MIYAVELYMDKAAEKTVADWISALPGESGQAGGPDDKRRVKLTLGKFRDLDETKAADKLQRLVRQHKKVKATFASVGVIPPGKLYLGPVLNEFLYSIHLEVHESFNYPKDGFEQFAFGNWLPHLILADIQDREVLLEAFEFILSQFRPLSAEFDRVALVRRAPDFKEIGSFKLRP